jgi:hypothetical protein
MKVAGRSYFGDTIGYGAYEKDFCEFLNLHEALIYSQRGDRQDTQLVNLTNKTISSYLSPEEVKGIRASGAQPAVE